MSAVRLFQKMCDIAFCNARSLIHTCMFLCMRTHTHTHTHTLPLNSDVQMMAINNVLGIMWDYYVKYFSDRILHRNFKPVVCLKPAFYLQNKPYYSKVISK
jgi:hypothetical protein